MSPWPRSTVREGTFSGGIPYLAVGSGEPLIYLCGSTPDHRNPKPGLERTFTLRTVNPLARAGFEVYFTNRWPDMAAETTFAEVAERHAEAIRAPLRRAGGRAGAQHRRILGPSADRGSDPMWCARRWLPAPRTRSVRLPRSCNWKLLHAIEATGRYSAEAIVDGMRRLSSLPVGSNALTPLRIGRRQADHHRESSRRHRHAAR